PYVEGESLRDRLDREKQLPIDDALRIAGEVADALQYAHEHGVIHRDIKPENILLQRGHAVVADFGIALAASKTGGSRMTETGMSLGTPTYMSPEQAMGAREVDARTDVYSLGCVLYEMLAGEPPFVGPTAQSIVAKVITESPKSLTGQRRTVPLHVDAAVQKTLEKLAADRFASAGAFAQALRDGGSSFHSSAQPMSRAATRSGVRVAQWAVATLIATAAVVGAYLAGSRANSRSANDTLLMQQKTFRTQSIFSARYTASGDAVVYSGAESGSSPRIYSLTSANPQPRAVSDSATHLLAISAKDEMAVLVGAVYNHHRVFTGTLARMPVGGGTPRELLTAVHDADWSPDGMQLAVVHEVNSNDRLEYPIGTVLYETPGSLSDVRVAPDGQHIAFNEHPERSDDRGVVAIVDLKGAHKVLTPQYLTLEGLAWTPDGRSLAFAAASSSGVLRIDEVTLGGDVLPSAPSIGNATIQDIGRDGRQLMIRSDFFKRIWVKLANDTTPRDLSWLDVSFLPVMSTDGSLLAFGDASNVSGENYSVMLRRTDGAPAVRIGEGSVLGMSADKQWLMSSLPSVPAKLMSYPTGAGTARQLDNGEFYAITAGAFVRNDSDIVVCGNEPKQAVRCYVRPLANGKFRPFTPEGVRGAVMSPDGQSIVALSEDRYRQFSVRDGTSQAVPGIVMTDRVLRYSPDGKFLWVQRWNSQPVRVEQVDLKSGTRTILLPDFSPRRPGVLNVPDVALGDNPRNFVYMERESSSYLFELKGKRAP
ncbi:MAG: protein kinase, partial [Gemmatimonadaceae bacterium]